MFKPLTGLLHLEAIVTYPLWLCCNDQSRRAIVSAAPDGWYYKPGIQSDNHSWESPKEIDRLMRQVPPGPGAKALRDADKP